MLIEVSERTFGAPNYYLRGYIVGMHFERNGLREGTQRRGYVQEKEFRNFGTSTLDCQELF